MTLQRWDLIIIGEILLGLLTAPLSIPFMIIRVHFAETRGAST